MKLAAAILVGIVTSASAFGDDPLATSKACVLTLWGQNILHMVCDGKKLDPSVDKTSVDDTMTAQTAELIKKGFVVRSCDSNGGPYSHQMRCMLTR